MALKIADTLPILKQNAAVDFPADMTIGGSSVSALGAVTSSSATALSVGLNGATNPAFNVDASTGSQASGLSIVGGTTTGTVAEQVIASGANANLIIDAKGSGTVKIANAAATSGLVTIGNSTSLAGAFVNGPLWGSRKVLASSGNTTLTAAMSGAVMLFDSAAGITYTLPAPAVGLSFDFRWTVTQTSSNHIVVTDAGTTFIGGGVTTFSGADVTPSATLGPKFFPANGTTHIKFTSNATTSGTAIGSWLNFVCYDSTHWTATGVVDSPSGTIVTPWST